MKLLGTEYLIQINLEIPEHIDVWYSEIPGQILKCRLTSCACIFQDTQQVYSTYKFAVLPGQDFNEGYLIDLEHAKVLKHYPTPGI